MKNNNELNPLIEGMHKDEYNERMILGAIFMQPDKLSQVIPMLKPEMFYYEINKGVFETMIQLFEQGIPIDLISVTRTMFNEKKTKWEYNNLGYEIGTMVRDVVTASNIVAWCYYLIETWQNRETFYIENGYYKGDSPRETRELISEKLYNLATKRTNDWVDASFVANQLIEHMEESMKGLIKGVKIGLPSFDSITKGGAKGAKLIVVGARPGVGKSAFINLWSTQAAKDKFTVGIINLEMENFDSFARMVSSESSIEYWRIIDAKTKDDREQKMMMDNLLNIANLPIWFSSSTDVNITDIRAKAVQLHKKANLGILFIDYLQLIEGSHIKNVNREQQIAQMTRGCKLLTKELGIPVVLLCQLNRESSKGGDKRPQITQLRESGAIEQDADIVILLHRDINEEGEIEIGNENKAFFKYAKHRGGKTTPWIEIGYDGPRMRFYEGAYPTKNKNTPPDSFKINRNNSEPPNIKPINDEPF